jgi:hypothetical protein
MPNFTLATKEQLQPKRRILLESDEKFQRIVKNEAKSEKHQHHYRTIPCSVIKSNGDLIQIIVLYDGHGKAIASIKKTWYFKINEETLEKEKYWDYVADIRELRTIALEHYFRRIKKRTKDGFMFD